MEIGLDFTYRSWRNQHEFQMVRYSWTRRLL